MANAYETSGLAYSLQLIDLTGVCINEVDYSTTGATLLSTVFDPFGDQIIMQTIGDRIASIRRKSHSELGEAWTKLAKM